MFLSVFIYLVSLNFGNNNWTPVKRYLQDELKAGLEQEKCFFDEYIPEELEAVIKRQHKVIQYQKQNDHKETIFLKELMTLQTVRHFPGIHLYLISCMSEADITHVIS